GGAVALVVSGGQASSSPAGGATGAAGGKITRPAAPKFTATVVGTRSFTLGKRRFIGAHLRVTRAASVTATLISPTGRPIYRWRLRVGTGTTIVRLVVPRQVQKPGRYTVVWQIASGGQTLARRITVRIAAGPKSRTTTKPATKPAPKKASPKRAAPKAKAKPVAPKAKAVTPKPK